VESAFTASTKKKEEKKNVSRNTKKTRKSRPRERRKTVSRRDRKRERKWCLLSVYDRRRANSV